jgi:hypothetical protein
MGGSLTVFRADGATETYEGDLSEAIRAEATYAASAAASDPLAGPTAEYVREQAVRNATHALRRPGDVYRGPAGGIWVMHRRDEDVSLDAGEPRFHRPGS